MSLLLYPLTVLFNGQSLEQVPGLAFLDRPINDVPDRTITEFPLARANKSQVTNAQFIHKTLILSGVINNSSRTITEQSIDQLKGLLQGLNQTLDVSQSGQTRRYFATLNKITTTLLGGNCTFTLEFLCSDPIGYDIGLSVFLNLTTVTVANTSFSVTNNGSFTAQPIIRATVNAVTGGTNAGVTITSTADNIGITVTRTWAAADQLVIDCSQKTVLVNNGVVNFTGRFPSFAPGVGGIGWADQFTTRNVGLWADYTRRFI